MTTRYLLPCACGNQIPVEVGQAGQTLRCRCGAALEVPTMLKMAALERAEPEPEAKQPSAAWEIRQSLVLLGAVIAAVSLGLAVYLYLTGPDLYSDRAIRRYVESLTPQKSWHRWQSLRARGPNPATPWSEAGFAASVFQNRLWIGVALTFTAGGAALIVIPLLKARAAAGGDSASEESEEED